MDSIASAGRAFDYLVQKYHVSVFLRHVHIEIFYTETLVFKGGKLVVMGGKQGSDMRFFVAKVFHRRPGDGKPVVGAGSPPDFVQDDQAASLCIVENIRKLAHFHEEGGLPLGKIVRSADTGKNSVADADSCPFARHETARLRHQNDEGGLSHIGGFSCHIRTCYEEHTFICVVEIGIV